jgi:periodic tryptophan protein 2
MNLNELEVESASDADPSDNYLPGAKKLDVSRRSKRMEISVNRIIVSDKEFAVGTNFGIMIFGLSRRSCFSPYELLPKLTPSMIPELLNEKQYTSAVIVALKLNIPIRKLLSKLHSKYTQQICEELSQ